MILVILQVLQLRAPFPVRRFECATTFVPDPHTFIIDCPRGHVPFTLTELCNNNTTRRDSPEAPLSTLDSVSVSVRVRVRLELSVAHTSPSFTIPYPYTFAICGDNIKTRQITSDTTNHKYCALNCLLVGKKNI